MTERMRVEPIIFDGETLSSFLMNILKNLFFVIVKDKSGKLYYLTSFMDRYYTTKMSRYDDYSESLFVNTSINSEKLRRE